MGDLIERNQSQMKALVSGLFMRAEVWLIVSWTFDSAMVQRKAC